MISYDKLLNEVEKLPSGTVFKVADLFMPLVWKGCSLGERRGLAIKYIIAIEDGVITDVELNGKGSSGGQLFKKK